MINVLVVSAVPVVREGLRGLLTPERDFQVQALAFDSQRLLEQILDAVADVVLIDVEVLESTGWELVRELALLAPTTRVLIVGDAPGDRRLVTALRLGARGYLLRDSSSEEMAAAVSAAYRGLLVVDSDLNASLLRSRSLEPLFGDEGGSVVQSETSENLIEPLSPREREVLQLMTRGMSNKQIAAALVITEHTVKFHIRAVLGKLGAANRTEAVTLALQKGLTTL